MLVSKKMRLIKDEKAPRRHRKKKPAPAQPGNNRGGRNQRGHGGKGKLAKPTSMQQGFDKSATVALNLTCCYRRNYRCFCELKASKMSS